MDNITMHKLAARKAGRERELAELRDGVRRRSSRIESGKRYTRKPKHGAWK